MTLHARSDLMSVSVPVASGGCGQTHSRPVRNGAPAKTWVLDCPPCERFLKGGGRTRLQYTPGDAKSGILPLQERVADTDPCWGGSPDSVPMTPDEHRVAKSRSERGAQQLSMIQSLAALRATGIDIPPEALWLLERELPESIIKGTALCQDGHDNIAGVKFCGECGLPMGKGVPGERSAEPMPAPFAGAAEGDGPPAEAVVDYARLHGQTLRKMARERGLSLEGSKEELIARLQAS